MEYLAQEHSGQLSSLANSDRLVIATGIARYVQDIVVPEIILMLVREDMKVGRSQAMQVVENSTALGELLHTD